MQKLWIDDLRDPPDNRWVVAVTLEEAIDFIRDYGLPDVISFDHDLGGEDITMRVVHFIVESYLDGKLEVPDGFLFRVHSANVVGAENIRSLMTNFLEMTHK